MTKTEFKSGFVAIIGRPNVGKSTFLNKVLSHKVSIVTPKAQTTRNRIQGIYTTPECQIVFVDTPGIHKAMHELGEVMNKTALTSMEGMDVLLYFVEANHAIDDLDRFIIKQFENIKCPIILVLNKIDLVSNEEELLSIINSYKQAYKFTNGITICAESGQSVFALLDMVKNLLTEGPMYYPEDQILDLPERFVVAEIIREKVLLKTEEEIPHSVAVTVESFKQNNKNPNLIEINATIIVERPSQKKIIIGAAGNKIKDIGNYARKDIARFLGNKVYLELFVKVEENWRNNKNQLREYGYRNE